MTLSLVQCTASGMTCSLGLVLVQVRLYWSPMTGTADDEGRVTEMAEKSKNDT